MHLSQAECKRDVHTPLSMKIFKQTLKFLATILVTNTFVQTTTYQGQNFLLGESLGPHLLIECKRKNL